MISNPCCWPTTTSGSRDGYAYFVYEGGSTLYHFSPHDCGIPGYSYHMAENLVFFANDEKHALDVLERMVKFRVRCAKVSKADIGRFEDASIVLAHKHLWKVSLAPTDQFYVVGWADNDTIF